jgi:hypothetical protein
VLNAHAPTEEQNDDSMDSFYDELEQFFDNFLTYHMKSLLRNFNTKLEREDIFKPTIGNESLHQDCNDNGVGIVNFVTSKIQWLRAQCSCTETGTPGPLLMGRHTKILITY